MSRQVSQEDWLAVWEVISGTENHLRQHMAHPAGMGWWFLLVERADQAFIEGHWPAFLSSAQRIVEYVSQVSTVPFGKIPER